MSQRSGWKVELSGYPGNYKAECLGFFILIVCFAFMSPIFQLRCVFVLSGQVDVATKIKTLSKKKNQPQTQNCIYKFRLMSFSLSETSMFPLDGK